MRGARRKEDCVHLSCNFMFTFHISTAQGLRSVLPTLAFAKRKAGWGTSNVAGKLHKQKCHREHIRDMLHCLKSLRISLLTHRRTWRRGSRSTLSISLQLEMQLVPAFGPDQCTDDFMKGKWQQMAMFQNQHGL